MSASVAVRLGSCSSCRYRTLGWVGCSEIAWPNGRILKQHFEFDESIEREIGGEIESIRNSNLELKMSWNRMDQNRMG